MPAGSECPSSVGVKRRARRDGLPMPLLVSGVVMVAWAFAVPIFEGPDEPDHWKYAQYVHQHHALPPFNPSFREGHSPPLYYLLIAPIASEAAAPANTFKYDAGGVRVSTSPPRFFQAATGDLKRYWPIRALR